MGVELMDVTAPIGKNTVSAFRRSLALQERISKLLKDSARHFSVPDRIVAYAPVGIQAFSVPCGLSFHHENRQRRSTLALPGVNTEFNQCACA